MYPNLKAEMARHNVTNEMIAKTLEINPCTLSAKLKKHDRFKLSECQKIKETYFPTVELGFLFATKDENLGL